MRSPAPQTPFRYPPYDTWREPGGSVVAEFYRDGPRNVVRFPGCADFSIGRDAGDVVVIPISEDAVPAAGVLLANSIVPMLANHHGGLFLHGSAVRIGERAAGFLGVSRSGKTTLAAAFARGGDPFLTEDAIELVRDGQVFTVSPKAPVLRLFPDSTRYLGVTAADAEGAAKRPIAARPELPACAAETPLAALYFLGSGAAASPTVAPLAQAAALSALLQHAFILDVEDRPRLKEHFGRLAVLAETVPCRHLDYPRTYDALPAVIDAVVDDMRTLCERAA